MNEKETALEKLIAIDDYDSALSMMDNGVGSINSTDRTGMTLLMRAIVNKDTLQIKKLLGRGADVRKQDSKGMTALHFAASGGYLDGAKLLVEEGVEINYQENNGNTAAHRAYAFRTGDHKAVLDFLIAKGIDLSIKNNAGVAVKNLLG